MSVDLDREIERLALTDKHIAEAEQRLADHISYADELRESGQSVDIVKDAIATIDGMLVEWRMQREFIAARIGALRAKLG